MLAIRKYCLVRDNEDLRILVRTKMKQKGLTFKELARQVDLDSGNINQWLSGLDSTAVKQWDVIRIARHLGIEVSLKITIYE